MHGHMWCLNDSKRSVIRKSVENNVPFIAFSFFSSSGCSLMSRKATSAKKKKKNFPKSVKLWLDISLQHRYKVMHQFLKDQQTMLLLLSGAVDNYTHTYVLYKCCTSAGPNCTFPFRSSWIKQVFEHSPGVPVFWKPPTEFKKKRRGQLQSD